MICPRSALAGLLLSTALATGAASADQARNPLLGIDCHLPRRADDGRIIPDFSGTARTLCEAYRATALHYDMLLVTTRDRVALALRTLPPPLLESLVNDLDNYQDPARWKPGPGARRDLGRFADAVQALHDAGRVTDDQLRRAKTLEGTADYWKDGLFTGTGITPEDWDIRAWACGGRDYDASGRRKVLVWFGPGTSRRAGIRDSWTPEMVQTAITAWHRLRDDLGVAIEKAPRVTGGTNGAPVLYNAFGEKKRIDACFGSRYGPWDALDPAPALAFFVNVGWYPKRETRLLPCADKGAKGYRTSKRYMLNGVFVDEEGAPLLPDLHGRIDNNGWIDSEHCSTPSVATVDDTEVSAKTCRETHGFWFPQGARTGWQRTFTFPDDWKRDPIIVTWVIDDCLRVMTTRVSETRTLACPAGQEGEIIDQRVETRTRRVYSDASTTPDTPWTVADPGYWRAIKNTCRRPPSGGGREDSEHSFDVDGDGQGDVKSWREAREYVAKNPGSHAVQVSNDCGACNGPEDRDLASERGGTDSGRSDGGGFGNAVSDLIESIFGGGDSDSGGGNSGGGGCFLTTAIVERRGEADDGPTLTALRAFRDGWMAGHPDGARLIAEYYAQAPRIVAAIPETHPDWDWIGGEIDRAVNAIYTNRPEAAFEIYGAMVRRLMARWLDAPEGRSGAARSTPSHPERRPLPGPHPIGPRAATLFGGSTT